MTTTQTKSLGIAMIGVGGIARDRHLPGLAKLGERVRLVAVANRHRENAEKAATTYGFSKVYSEWRQAVEDEAVDIVWICTPPQLHREITLYALSLGKHVFSQARMALDYQDALPMWQADQKTALTTMLCRVPHYLEVEPQVKRLLEEKAVGEIRHVVVNHPSAMFLDASAPLHWRQQAALQGINLLDVGITAEVLNDWIGPTASLFAESQTYVTMRVPGDSSEVAPVDLPDAVSISGKMVNGALLTASFSGAIAGGQGSLTLHGDRGSLICYLGKTYYDLCGLDKEPRRIHVPLAEQGEWLVEADMIEAVLAERKGKPSFSDGMAYMAFTQAVHDSIASGKREVLRTDHLI